MTGKLHGGKLVQPSQNCLVSVKYLHENSTEMMHADLFIAAAGIPHEAVHLMLGQMQGYHSSMSYPSRMQTVRPTVTTTIRKNAFQLASADLCIKLFIIILFLSLLLSH